MGLTPKRLGEVDSVLEATHRWAVAQPDIRALALVGSWARNEARMSSDIDLVLLTENVQHYVARTEWIQAATSEEGSIVRSKAWGPMRERRVELASGLLVEYGFASPSWASVDPLDPGTASVVADGCRVLYDPDGMLEGLVSAVEQLRP
jgi:predicted nucleotidyltransferase